MADYTKDDARAWAREHLTGCSAVTIPTFTADLKRLGSKRGPESSRERRRSTLRPPMRAWWQETP